MNFLSPLFKHFQIKFYTWIGLYCPLFFGINVIRLHIKLSCISTSFNMFFIKFSFLGCLFYLGLGLGNIF